MKTRAEEEGLSLDEVVGTRGNGERRRPTVRYRNPLDPSQTWSGRGRRPGWLEAVLKEGKSLESLRV
jgi:DNA-binding protein H-NS